MKRNAKPVVRSKAVWGGRCVECERRYAPPKRQTAKAGRRAR